MIQAQLKARKNATTHQVQRWLNSFSESNFNTDVHSTQAKAWIPMTRDEELDGSERQIACQLNIDEQ